MNANDTAIQETRDQLELAREMITETISVTPTPTLILTVAMLLAVNHLTQKVIGVRNVLEEIHASMP